MNFLTIAYDKFVKYYSIGFVVLLLVFVLGCASSMQQKQVCPESTIKRPELEDTLPSVKPVIPSVVPGSHATQQEIEVHDHMQMDSVPIEKE